MPISAVNPRAILRHWPKLAIVVALAAMLVPLLIAAFREMERAEQKRDIKMAMHQIGIALHNYADIYGRFPEPVQRDKQGRPLGSWRMAILPFMAMGYDMPYTERWDDPEFRWRSMEPHRDFCFRQDMPDRRRLHTNIVAITGPGTFFELGKFTPGTSNIIVAIEVAESGYHWMEPGDLSMDEVTPAIMKGVHGDGLHVLCASAAVHFISADAPFEDVKKFFAVENSGKYNLQEVLGPYIR
jgi:hypothetical protein